MRSAVPKAAPQPAPMNVLLLCALPPVAAGTIRDHVHALTHFSRHQVNCFPHVGVVSNRLPQGIDLERFDAVVIHYSVYLLADSYVGPGDRARISAYRGVKLLFLQDEYRQVDRVQAVIRELGVDVLFTCLPKPEIEKVYPAAALPGLTKISNLTGYVPKALAAMPVPSIDRRPIDVGYRARIVPFWLGLLGAEKWQIAPRFLAAVEGSGLACNISNREEDRIYGEGWIRFVSSCKTMLGVESGASVFDFDGTIQRTVHEYLARNPGASFEQVEDRFLRPHEGKIRLNQISPRCFEATALRTTMVLFEGDYSGILEPWKHYIPLRKDFSNVTEVVNAIKNTPLLQEIADRAYREIALNPEHSYEAFVARFDAALSAAHALKGHSPRPPVSRAWFFITTLPAAVFPRLVRVWLMIPPAIRSRLKPLAGPLISALRR